MDEIEKAVEQNLEQEPKATPEPEATPTVAQQLLATAAQIRAVNRELEELEAAMVTRLAIIRSMLGVKSWAP